MKKLLFFWSELKSTFWFIPVIIILLSIGMALAFLHIDSLIAIPQNGIGRFLFITNADSARSILATISGAMIGVAGTVFSITLVALTLASSQFGSRLIKNFMYDHLNQVVLGSYISTYIYCLIVLNTISENVHFVPSLSILVALLAAVANIVFLIVFIHHVAISIQADTVISNISESLTNNMKTLFPETIGVEKDEAIVENIMKIQSEYNNKQSIKAPSNGYLQYINSEALMNIATELDVLIELHFRPGDYLVHGVELGMIYTNENIEKTNVNKLQAQFITGKTRTHQQDPEHTIHQMVEIASRALSPGVNDPYTAITCIDNLTTTMTYLSSVQFPSEYLFDNNGTLRVIADTLSYQGMLDAAFNQIRQFAKGSPSVVIRLMEALITINGFTKKQDYKNAIKKHAKMILNMAKDTFNEPFDLEDLKQRSKIILGGEE